MNHYLSDYSFSYLSSFVLPENAFAKNRLYLWIADFLDIQDSHTRMMLQTCDSLTHFIVHCASILIKRNNLVLSLPILNMYCRKMAHSHQYRLCGFRVEQSKMFNYTVEYKSTENILQCLFISWSKERDKGLSPPSVPPPPPLLFHHFVPYQLICPIHWCGVKSVSTSDLNHLFLSSWILNLALTFSISGTSLIFPSSLSCTAQIMLPSLLSRPWLSLLSSCCPWQQMRSPQPW